MGQTKVTLEIELTQEQYDRIKKEARYHGFGTVADYLKDILRELFGRLQSGDLVAENDLVVKESDIGN